MVNPIDKYGRPGSQGRQQGVWDEVNRHIATVREQLVDVEGNADYGTHPMLFLVRAHMSARFNDDARRNEFLERVETALYAEGWNCIIFDVDQKGFGGVWVNLYALKEPLVVTLEEGDEFPAIISAEVTTGPGDNPNGLKFERLGDAAERICREGCWRYTPEYREWIPPRRIAAVRHYRRA